MKYNINLQRSTQAGKESVMGVKQYLTPHSEVPPPPDYYE